MRFRYHAQLSVLVLFLCTVALAQAPPPAGFPGKAPEGPPAEIVRFEAAPAAIESGQSVTLRWEALNAFSLSIAPAIGAVATRGTRTLAPSATTTYTLTVTGSGGTKTASTTVTVNGTVASTGSLAAGSEQRVPKLADGYLGGRDIKVTAPPVAKPGAESYRVPVRAEDLGQGAQCLPSGVPGVTLAPYPLQIVAKPDLVVILYEAFNIFRIIQIRPSHSDDIDATWLGNSVAHWDGDTLVVDVVGFNDKTTLAGFRHTESLHVVERYRRASYGVIAYEATAEDPNVFAQPVKYAGNLALHPEWEIGEYVCAENNKDYHDLLEPRRP
jgi:hypothetical protein